MSVSQLSELAEEKADLYRRVNQLEEENNKLLTEIKTLKCEIELLTVSLKGILKTFDQDQSIGEFLKNS